MLPGQPAAIRARHPAWQKPLGGGKTRLVLHELYPSKEALDAAGTGAADAMGETFEQLDELLVTLGASVGRP
jgi:hypothetical protein